MPDDTGTEKYDVDSNNEHAAAQDPPGDPPGSARWLAAQVKAIRRRIEEVREEIADLRSDLPAEAEGLLTYEDVAERLNVSVRHVQMLAHSGELTPIRIGRAVRFDPETIEAFIRSKAEEGEA